MTDRNKSGENVSAALAEDPLRDLAENGSTRVEELISKPVSLPGRRRIYVSALRYASPGTMQRNSTPSSSGTSKPTRELPAETLALLKECCK